MRTHSGLITGGIALGLSALLLAGCAHKVPTSSPKATTAAQPVKTTPSPATAPTPAPKPNPNPTPGATPAAAASPAPGTAAAAPPRPPSPPPLVGHVTRDDLEGYSTWKELRAQDYTPDAAQVSTIAAHVQGVQMLAIVGTWCGDSKREVPRFFKIADQAKFPLSAVTLVAVDRSKKDTEGLTEKHAITRVPTFVFFRGGQEIGRVTEKPAAGNTLEGEIATIVTK